jgi:NitT/TauT family transport system permease protein
MIFTGQVWNMTFSFYGSLRAIPLELREASHVYRFGWWKTFTTLEVPAAMIGLVWNSMMSMAGGWFFLTVNEAFTLGDHDFRLPGIGSYMSVAIDRGDTRAMAAATVAMIVMIVVVDQLVWRPALAWAQKFKLEDTEAGEAPRSWVLDLLRRSRAIAWMERQGGRLLTRFASDRAAAPAAAADERGRVAPRIAGGAVGIAFGLLALWGAAHLLTMLHTLTAAEWIHLARSLGLTFLRTYAALAIGALWTVPVGIWIGLSPARTRILQPIIQVAAAFPAPDDLPARRRSPSWPPACRSVGAASCSCCSGRSGTSSSTCSPAPARCRTICARSPRSPASAAGRGGARCICRRSCRT